MKLFELNKIAADVFTKRRLNNELSPETVDTYLKNGYARDERTYANGPAKGVKNLLHNVAWDRYKNQKGLGLAFELAKHPEFKNVDDLRQLPEHRLASYKLMPKIKRVSIPKKSKKGIDPKFSKKLQEFQLAAGGGGYATIPAGMLDNKGSIVALKPKSLIAKTTPLTPIIGSKHTKKFADNTALLHEAFETHYANQIANKNVMQASKLGEKKEVKSMQSRMLRETSAPNKFTRLFRRNLVRNGGKTYQTVGMHMDPRVLTNEAKVVSSNPYSHMGRTFRNVRDKTGEREMFKQHLGRDVYTQGVKPGDYRRLMDSLSRSNNVVNTVEKGFPYNMQVKSLVVPKKQGMLSSVLSKTKSLFRR